MRPIQYEHTLQSGHADIMTLSSADMCTGYVLTVDRINNKHRKVETAPESIPQRLTKANETIK